MLTTQDCANHLNTLYHCKVFDVRYIREEILAGRLEARVFDRRNVRTRIRIADEDFRAYVIARHPRVAALVSSTPNS